MENRTNVSIGKGEDQGCEEIWGSGDTSVLTTRHQGSNLLLRAFFGSFCFLNWPVTGIRIWNSLVDAILYSSGLRGPGQVVFHKTGQGISIHWLPILHQAFFSYYGNQYSKYFYKLSYDLHFAKKKKRNDKLIVIYLRLLWRIPVSEVKLKKIKVLSKVTSVVTWWSQGSKPGFIMSGKFNPWSDFTSVHS